MTTVPFITHPTARTARREIFHLIEHGNDPNIPNIQFVVGPTGVGKSALVKTIVNDKQFQLRDGPDGIIRPVLLVEAPHQGTIKGLAEVMLRELGDPHPSRGTETEMKDRIYNYLTGQGTRLIIIDEVQQLSRSNPYTYAEFLKTMKNNTACPILCVGLADALELPRSNAQLRRRCRPPIELRALDWFKQDEQKIYRQVLASFRQIFAARFKSLQLENELIAAATHIASRGAVGATHDFLCQCIVENDLDQSAESDQVEVRHMASAFDRLHRGERPTYNPFTVAKLPTEWSPLPFEAGVRQKGNDGATRRAAA